MEGKDRGQKVEASKGERKNVEERGEGEGEAVFFHLKDFFTPPKSFFHL